MDVLRMSSNPGICCDWTTELNVQMFNVQPLGLQASWPHLTPRVSLGLSSSIHDFESCNFDICANGKVGNYL